MKKTRFTESQIFGILKQQENGIPTKELCREHGISPATFYNLKGKYGGMEVSDVKKMKELEEENAKLKRMCKRRLSETVAGEGDPTSKPLRICLTNYMRHSN